MINLKAILLLLIVSFAISIAGNAQKIEVSAAVQQTIMGVQKGYDISYRMKSGFSLGTFFQSSNNLSFEKSADNYPFMGLNIGIPIKDCGSVALMGNIRTGLVNQSFFIVTPEIETRLSLNKIFKLGITAGTRSRQATVGAKLIVSIL